MKQSRFLLLQHYCAQAVNKLKKPISSPLSQITDVVVGTGPAAKSGDTVTMRCRALCAQISNYHGGSVCSQTFRQYGRRYRGTLEDGTEFDSGDRFKFTIDAGEVRAQRHSAAPPHHASAPSIAGVTQTRRRCAPRPLHVGHISTYILAY